MINEKIKIHGGVSFEINLDYVLNQLDKKSEYDVDTYIFIPSSLDITSETYSKTDFFQNIKSNIRFITPLYKITEIIEGYKSVYNNLVDSINNYLTYKTKNNATKYWYHLKMFVSIFSSTLSKHVTKIVSTKNIDKKIELINELNVVSKILEKYRLLKPIICTDNFKDKEKDTYKFGNEFLSYSIEKQYLFLIKKLSRKKYISLSNEVFLLKKTLLKELKYQKKNKIIRFRANVSDADVNEINESSIYRRGVLRKFADDNLFLTTRTKKEGVMMEQVIFSLSAGLAMIFATSAAFMSQLYYGNFTQHLFIALVISYMAKDRIKELVRNTINKKIQAKFFFDRKTKIISGTEDVGYTKESFLFLDNDKIPKQVLLARKKKHITGIENDWKGEKVMLYRKNVVIYNSQLDEVLKGYEIGGVKEIVRLNVLNFTSKMSSVNSSYYAWDDIDESIKRVKAERIYHLNIVLNFKNKNTKKEEVKRYRVFLNKKVVKRIEKVKV